MSSEQAISPSRRASPGRPPRFGDDDLIGAALALGPEQLTLGAVSDALGAPHTTIYNHVRSTEELGRRVLVALLERAYDEPPEIDGTSPWPGLLTTFADEIRTSMLAAGPWLRFLSRDLAQPALHRADDLLGALVEHGFTIESAGNAIGLLRSVVLDSVNFHAALAGGAQPTVPFDAFAADEYPWIKAAHALASDADGDERRYRYNLTCVIEGIRIVHEHAQLDATSSSE